MTKPSLLFTVAVPAYNAEDFISHTLDSVKRQTFTDYEIVVVDDGSKDKTSKQVEEWAKNNPSIAIRLIRQNNKGIGGARNACIQASQGEYVAFLDADDLWIERKLEIVAKHTEQFPSVDLICHDAWLETGSTRKLMKCGPYAKYKDLLFNGNHIFTSATVVKRKRLLEANGFSEDLRFNGVEDFELWLRLAKAGCNFYFLHKPLGVYRSNGQGITGNVVQHCKHTLNVLNYHFDNWYSKTLYYRYLMQRHRSAQYHWVGNNIRKQGNYREAQEFLRMSLKEDPFNYKAWILTLMNLLKIRK